MTNYYTEWNLLLLSEYFSPAVANEEVWVLTNREELDAFGFHLGGAGGLIDTVKQGPIWRRYENQTMANVAKDLARQRLNPYTRCRDYQDPGKTIETYQGLNAPTYLPYVALWVLAASENSQGGFYSTVSNLTGLPFNGGSARNAMEMLWLDLEKWSKREVGGALGNFRSRPLGGYPFVGLAKAQALVTGKDKDGIHRLFKQAGLAPGQELSKKMFSSLAGIAVNTNFLTAGLREALRQVDIYGAVLKEIFRFRLAEWDGRLPRPKNRARQTDIEVVADDDSRESEDELSLILKPALNVDWEIGWRLQATFEAASYKIRINDVCQPAYPDETGSYLTCIGSDSEAQEASRAVLIEAISHDILANLDYARDGDENGEGERSCWFSSNDTRVMVWDTLSPTDGEGLVESELPISGAAYLLLSERTNLEYLRNERIEYRQVDDTKGLPNSWLLVLISKVEDLSPDQKKAIQELTGGTLNVYARARIKFVGGCPILRGGAKQYAHYDLPIVEMEAPVGSEIRAIGLEFSETSSQEESSQVGKTTRRFQIYRKESDDKHQFEITVFLGGETLLRTRLRVAPSGGVAIGLDKNFSIGRFGESIRGDDGVRGAILGDTISLAREILVQDTITSRPWGRALSEQTGEEYFDHNIACKFLDMVAQRGSIEFGPARKLIQRLAQDFNGCTVHPVFLMFDLRSRGHVEIETDQKGHLLRVHAVAPLLYSLPVVNESSNRWYGVCGSLRLEHWYFLYSQQEIPARFEASTNERLPVLRLSVSEPEVLQHFAQEAEFELAELPATRVTYWAGTLDEFRESLQLSSGYESFRVKNQERLNPLTVCFNSTDDEYMRVDNQRQSELFRFDDPVIQGTQAYMLGTLKDDRLDFNYVQDSRWGIWLATSAFARMVARMGNPDACPWPLPYSVTDGSVWIPARMKPPLVIERALCLCSGSGPRKVLVDEDTDAGDDFVRLIDTQMYNRVIGRVSKVYTDTAKGTWLCYQWVPRNLANQLADHLGCELMEM